MNIPKIEIRNNFDIIDSIKSVKKLDSVCSDNIQISYIVPTFNRLDTLEQAVNSIISAEHVINYEIIIGDNSADISDNNPVYKFLKGLNHKHIRLFVHEQNLGMAGNWNRCIELARAPYVAMLHDDDLISQNYELEILKCINIANKQDKQFAFIIPSRYSFDDGEEIPVINDCKEGMIRPIRVIDCLLVGKGGLLAPTCGTLFFKEAILKVGGFDQRYYPSFDHLLGFELIRRQYVAYKTIAVLGYYRWGVNETLNKGMLYKFYIMDAAIRDYMYFNCGYNHLFVEGLKVVHYKQRLRDYIAETKRQGETLVIEDVDFLNIGCKYPAYYFLYHWLKMIVKHTNRVLR